MHESRNTELELELTYLLRIIPAEIKGAVPTKIRDIYVPEDSDRSFIRLRQKDNKFEIIKKMPVSDQDFSVQTEQTIPLSQEEFNALARSSNRWLEKDRYIVTINGAMAEVDLFKGDLAGLALVDFEFKTPELKSAFRPPQCCLAEVTQERFIAGSQLAGKKYRDIQADLERFNYKSLIA